MPNAPHCSKCGSTMAAGFVVDHSYGSYTVANWIEGVPEKSFWTGIKISGKAQHHVTTWRCNRCGFLESYTPVG